MSEGRVLGSFHPASLPIPMRGNEPEQTSTVYSTRSVLPIPMRGNELLTFAYPQTEHWVTNPHEG